MLNAVCAALLPHHFTGWQNCRPWKRNLFPERHGRYGTVTQKLYETLTGIHGRLEAPEGWLKVIE